MKTVSLKIDDSIFDETEKILAKIKKPRNRYTFKSLAPHLNNFIMEASCTQYTSVNIKAV